MAKAAKVSGVTGATNFKVAIGRIIETRFDEMLRHKSRTILGRDPEALHDMRVASRRLRAAMDVAVTCFPRKYGYFHRTVKELTDVLGGVRDYDVMRAALTDYRQSRPEPERVTINRILQAQRQERDANRAALIAFFEHLDDERFDVRFRGFLAEHTHG
ncbi:MAG TPA: CHAD domain-containing protein [Thermomicrobiales bacterium]|nr:CHAD domain-containing protein [Thermomicrobiales bacterium]